MTAVTPLVLVAFTRCRQCERKPDPKSKALRETQADKHGDIELHVVEYGLMPQQTGAPQ